MSQDLYFYKLQVFAEDFAKNSSHEEINEMLIKMTEGLKLEGDGKKQEKYFEEIKTVINISGNEIQELIPKKTLADTRYFLVNQQVLDKIRQIILKQGQEIKTQNQYDLYKLYKEFDLIEDICQKNLLMINVF